MCLSGNGTEVCSEEGFAINMLKLCMGCGKANKLKCLGSFCNGDCYREAKKNKTFFHTCKNCGKMYIKTNRKGKFCSRECGRKLYEQTPKYKAFTDKQRAIRKAKCLQKHPLINKICPICNASFSTTKAFKIYCTKKCAGVQWNKLTRAKRIKKEVIYDMLCVCGVAFKSKFKLAKYCSDECARKQASIQCVANTKAKSFSRQYDLIDDVCNKYKLLEDTRNRLMFLFHKTKKMPLGGHYCVKAGNTRNYEQLVEALAIFIMKQEGYDLSLRFGADKIDAGISKFERRIRWALEARNNSITFNNPYVINEIEADRICNRFNCDKSCIMKANKMLSKIETAGRNPKVLKGEAIYLILENKITQKDVADLFGITETALRSAKSLFGKQKV